MYVICGMGCMLPATSCPWIMLLVYGSYIKCDIDCEEVAIAWMFWIVAGGFEAHVVTTYKKIRMICHSSDKELDRRTLAVYGWICRSQHF